MSKYEHAITIRWYNDGDQCWVAMWDDDDRITGYGDSPSEALSELMAATSLAYEVLREAGIDLGESIPVDKALQP